jgi:hypothetical protein
MSFLVEGIPQRETLPDPRRIKLMERMAAKGIDPAMLPITPATIIVAGRIGSGKSSIMYSWLKNQFPRYYDECLIFCASADSKDAFESLPQKRVEFFLDYDDEGFTGYIEALKEHQRELMEEGKPPLNIFIGFDDIVFSNAISRSGKPSMVERLMLICRHELNATVMICVQHSKQVNPAMRNNTLYWICLPLQSNDLAKIAEEHACHLRPDQFVRMYHNIMGKGKHEFMVIDYKAPEPLRFRHRWDKIIALTDRDESTAESCGCVSDDDD